MRRLSALVGLLLLAAFSTPSVKAALQFDVHVGYEGNIHEASWFPIVCEIFNDGPSFNAVIEVSGGQYGSEQVREVPVELPTNTRKRIVIPMFASGGRFSTTEWVGRLLSTSGKVIQERRNIQTKMVAWESTLLGALPRNFGGSPTFPEPKQSRVEMKPEVARFTVDQFPDNPITLEGLNAIYLNSEKAPDLKVTQVTALLGWVRAGGHLIVSAEQISDVNGTPWLKQFLPMELTDTRNLRLDQEILSWVRGQPVVEETSSRRSRRVSQPAGNAYQEVPEEGFKDAEMPVSTGTTRDGFVLVSAENVPLMVQAPRGRGRITLLTFSPEREPFRSWKGRSYFWAKLAGIPSDYFTSMEHYNTYNGASIDGVFGALIDSRQIKKLPVTWLLLLLVVYLVVIGPFDQWWLKKIGKQMLTWITFPTYVVLFSLLIYFIGYKLRAGETEWNELNIVDVLPRGEKVDLRGRTYISIYSSSNARYPLNGQQGHATLRGELMDFRSGGKEASKARVVHNGNSFKAEVDVAVWTSSLYANEWFKTNDTPFIATVMESGSEYQVDIENLLNRPLTNVRVVAGQMIFQVGEVPANEKKTFILTPEKGIPLRSFVQENAQYFQRAVELRSNPLGDTSGGHIEDRALTATVASFISYLDAQQGRSFVYPPGIDLRAQVERGDAVVFAWVPGYSFGDKINDFQPPRFKQDTMLRLTVPVRQKNPI
ncbi:MAG: hypothetical protein ACXW3L_06360 [Limisphaerales bacterium]